MYSQKCYQYMYQPYNNYYVEYESSRVPLFHATLTCVLSKIITSSCVFYSFKVTPCSILPIHQCCHVSHHCMYMYLSDRDFFFSFSSSQRTLQGKCVYRVSFLYDAYSISLALSCSGTHITEILKTAKVCVNTVHDH